MNLFDHAEAQRRKADGQQLAANNRDELLTVARSIAREVAELRGRVTADDVAAELDRRGLPQLGPAAGSLFRGSQWQFTGKRVVSKQLRNHGRELKVWELKGD